MSKSRSPVKLMELFAEKTVVDLPAIRSALGDISIPTAYRYLNLVPHRRSYNHNGRYYTLDVSSRFDRLGLWTFNGIHFSVDGSLKNTVRRMVCEASAGASHKELQGKLQLRVQNTLLDLWRNNEIARESLDGDVYIYFHSEVTVHESQLALRREMLLAQQTLAEVTDAIVIEVLLVLIRYPDAQFADVVRRLKGHSPPIRAEHVRLVFDRYDLDHLGEKGGL